MKATQEFALQTLQDVRSGKYANDLSKLTFIENQMLLIEENVLRDPISMSFTAKSQSKKVFGIKDTQNLAKLIQ